MLINKVFFLLTFFSFITSHAMEQELQPTSYPFSCNFKPYLKNIDITEWSLETKSKDLFSHLKKNKYNAEAKHYTFLFHGDCSFNTALTLASYLEHPYLIIDGSNEFNDDFISKLKRPQLGDKVTSHTIIIKELSFLLANTIEKNKNSDRKEDELTEEFCNMLKRLKFEHTYLIFCESGLKNLPGNMKELFREEEIIHEDHFIKADPHEDELYFEALWPIINTYNYPHFLGSLRKNVKCTYYANGTPALHKLISLFKKLNILPQDACAIMEKVPVAKDKDMYCYGLDDVLEQIQTHPKPQPQQSLVCLPSAKCGLCMGIKNNYFKTPCCIQEIIEETDHTICSECFISLFIDKDAFDCPYCRKPIQVESKLVTKLVISPKESK